MARFEFEAKDRSGTVHRDRLEAADLQHACHLLSARNWFVVKIEEEGGTRRGVTVSANGRLPAGTKNFLARNFLVFKARRKYVPVKTEQMAQLIRAGMRLSEALSVMSRRSTDPAWGTVFEDLRAGVVSGKSLSESMITHPKLFNSLFRAMVAAGEVSGHLVEVLERLAHYLQRREAIQQRVTGALIYPSMIVVAGIATLVFFMVGMLPNLSRMFKELGKALPWQTQMLISTSDILTRFGWLIPVVIFVGCLLGRHWLRDSQHRLLYDRSKLRWPVIGNLLSLNEHSRFTQTLSTLLHSGITLVDALQVAEATLTNTALKTAIREARVQVREGKSLNDALTSQKLFPDLMLDMLAVGERTGDLSGALRHTAETYERELERAIQNFTALIEPALLVLMAIFVGSIVFGVLVAVFSLTSGLGRM